MDRRKGFQYQIQYTKAADKFFFSHEDVRQQYEDAIRELLVGDHPESVNVKKIPRQAERVLPHPAWRVSGCVFGHQWHCRSYMHAISGFPW